MKGLIMAGGLSTRLKPITNDLPKSLVKIGERTILGRIIDSLLEHKVKDLVIITGYLEKEIKKFVKKNYPNLKPTYVFNPKYQNTKIRYIYAMYLAEDALRGDDVLYIHGDVFCDPILIKRLVRFPHSGALVNKSFVSEKDFNARVKNGLITEIGVKVYGKGTGFCLPVYKLLRNDFKLWLEKIGEYVEKSNLDCYAENALNEVLGRIKLYPVYFGQEIGMEIDDFEDLKKAEGFLKSGLISFSKSFKL